MSATTYHDTRLQPAKIVELTFELVDRSKELGMAPQEILGALPVILLTLSLVGASQPLTDADLAEILEQPRGRAELIRCARRIAAAWKHIRDEKAAPR